MGRKTRYIVSITRLNVPHTVYASVPCEEAAGKLAEKAKELGYTDVEVFAEKDFRKAKNAKKKKRWPKKAVEKASKESG